jgi:beta-glucosidase-like glycosyl hydrolase/CubicO group peptidase (beta-lactamase class C family)
MRWFYLIFFLILFEDLCSQKIEFSESDKTWARKELSRMNLREKIGQLFMVDISPKLDQTANKTKLLELISRLHIGGIIIMKGEYSLTSEWIHEFQKESKTPLLIATDGEWGIHMRIANTTKFPYAMTLGAIQEDKVIYEMGKAIANDFKRLGIHVNFAPVVDVNVNPKNPVINYRSFGESKTKVAEKALQYALGMQDNGVMACLKHFPGHGDTDIDSHFELPVINKPREQINNLELYPFQYLIDKNIWGVMVAHLKVPSMDASQAPTSLSRPVITEILKGEMGFQGLVFSDAMNMKGIGFNTAEGQIELDAYLAGNDVLLMSSNVEKGMDRIEQYMNETNSEIAELNERVLKLLMFKHKLNAHKTIGVNYRPDETTNIPLSKQLYTKAITLLSDDQIPADYWMDSSKKTLFISLTNKITELRTNLERTTHFTFFNLPSNTVPELYKNALATMRNYDNIIIAYHDLSQSSSKNFGLNESQIDFIKSLKNHDNILHLWFGNPYGLKYFQNASNVVVTYEDNTQTENAVFRILNDRSVFEGHLPISAGKYKAGMGYKHVDIKKTVVSDIAMDETQMDKASILMKIESLANEIVYDGVAPGLQMVVYFKGGQLYNKCFGRHTYAPESQSVRTTDIYDLASLTKILSTTLASMKLYDQGLLDLHKTVGDYIYLDDSSTIKNIYIYQLLTHDAGLTPFIPFYQRFNLENYYQYFSNTSDNEFNIQVADAMYLRSDYKDSMWHEMSHSELKHIGTYKYSDLSMYILQKVIESITHVPLDQYVSNNFYKKMGIGLTYHPLNKYPLSRIVPTEFDATFRIQQLQGYVHDQGCALYGGICGHAGLFGSASDVAKVMQMLINGGKWNGMQLLNPAVIAKFSEQQRIGSRRGLGFDKPNLEDPSSSPCASECSFATIGHTGFTGACAWADPFSELVFVFLSNRIYPSTDNKKLARGHYRERLQSLFYKYINSTK